jgi:hypothetical protein
MNLANLLEKLIEIELSIGVDSDYVVRKKMQDVQDYVLLMQRERALKLLNEHRYRAA